MNIYYLISSIFLVVIFYSIKFRVNHLIKNYHYIFILTLLILSFYQKDHDLTFIFALFVGSLIFKNYFVEKSKLTKFVKLTLFIVFIVALIEIFLGESYHRFLNTFSYYLNSRGRYSPIAIDIYTQIGAYRGSENYFLSFINYRISSIFLEPLGLAYFCIICLGYLRSISADNKILIEIKNNFFSYLIIILLLIASDTRSSLVIFVLIWIVPKTILFQRKTYLLSMLLVTLSILTIYLFSDLSSENYRRIIPTISAFIDMGSIFNITQYKGVGILDSGYGILISNLGIFGLVYFIFFISSLSKKINSQNSSIYFYNFGVFYILYFAIFGGAFYSMKIWLLLIIMLNSISLSLNEQKN